MQKREDINRETLYAEIWRMPMIDVGKKYGLSRPTIKWACQELDVPLPPQAYWAHRAAGLVVPAAPPLPPHTKRNAISLSELRKREPKKRRLRTSHVQNELKRQLLYEEAVKHEELLIEVESWHQAESIRHYLGDLDRRVASGGMPVNGYHEWRAMVERYVADLCPAEGRVSTRGATDVR